MKRIAAILVLLFILAMTLNACGGSSTSKTLAEGSTQHKMDSIDKPEGEAPKPDDKNVSQTTKEAQTSKAQADQTASATKDSGLEVVAKSNNTVSSEDKEALMRELDKELDSLFSNIDSMEDLQDSDLELN